MTTATQTASKSRKRVTTRSLVVTAMLSAVAFVLMFIEVPIPMLIPSFVKLDISDLPALLGSFALGPVYGVVVELIKNLLHILIKGTSSAYVVCYGMPMEAIIGMYQAILPSANSLLKCLVIFNLPFTFCKGLIDAILCFLIYKPLSPLMHGRQ